ncbi:ParB/RepB/Spo0J family partition protein [Cytobacillus horneckiae]|nr:ParB/RepB/Spo0J family partition protein [Cytobacillus horneckiae]MEC1157568.1 ParB N-terminal domain-containing protein [Cytobacillus horneckiae]MED2939516.1 ParB N-terminal domain-containing protein [Cytobacillus horneckiae]
MVQQIKVDQIKVKHYQVWPDMNKEAFKSLVEDIKSKEMIIYPLLLDENLTVLDGHQRLKAAKLLDFDEVACLITIPMSEEEKLEVAHTSNATARTISTADKKKRARELRAEQRSYRQIAEWVGVSKSSVERWLKGVPSGTGNRVKGSDGKEYPAKKPKRHKESSPIDSEKELRTEVSALETEIATLKGKLQEASADNKRKDDEINRLTRALNTEKLANSFFRGGDNGMGIFASMVGLDETASLSEIDRAFRKARAKAHPDSGGNEWVSQRYNVGYDLFKRLYIKNRKATG